MKVVLSALKDFSIEASDGSLGSAGDFLFDEKSWRVRWVVVNTGSWLARRRVLVHPSAIGSIDLASRRIPVALTKSQVEASPSLDNDQPLSGRDEDQLYSYYGWSSDWAAGYLGPPPVMTSLSAAPAYFGIGISQHSDDLPPDPDRRSASDVASYAVEASDGEIGHIEDFLIDTDSWRVDALIAATRNWWPGQHVKIAPELVTAIDWAGREMRLKITRDEVKASPPWDPVAMMKQPDLASMKDDSRWPMTAP